MEAGSSLQSGPYLIHIHQTRVPALVLWPEPRVKRVMMSEPGNCQGSMSISSPSPITHFNGEKGSDGLSSKVQTWYFVRWMFCLPILRLRSLSSSTVRSYKCKECTQTSSESLIWYFVGFYIIRVVKEK